MYNLLCKMKWSSRYDCTRLRVVHYTITSSTISKVKQQRFSGSSSLNGNKTTVCGTRKDILWPRFEKSKMRDIK